jgi:prephenate dehydrogenase
MGYSDSKRKLTIGIIGGRGTLGKIFKKFFRKHGFKVLISGRKTKLKSIELAKKSDVVVFSVPINMTAKVIRDVLPYTRKEQLLMDFTSIKEFPIREMLKSKSSVIGLHPMFGKVSFLRGKTIIVVPARPRQWAEWLLTLFKEEKINIKITNAKKHDKIMAILQGLIHFSFLTTAYALKEISKEKGIKIGDLLDYGGVIYRMRLGMIERVLSQDPKLYGDIAMLNQSVKNYIKTYEKDVRKLSKTIAKKDKKEFERFFNEASSFFVGFKDEALKESEFLIEQLSKLKTKKKVKARGKKKK